MPSAPHNSPLIKWREAFWYYFSVLVFIATPANFSANALGYQHHVLDRILRLVMEDELLGSTKSPDIDFFFYERFDKSLRSTK